MIPHDRLGDIFAPLAYLLASGGDTRLHLDPETRLNFYGCRPYPRPEAFTFASSTATSISARAYAAAERAREELIRWGLQFGLERAVDERVELLRGELTELLGLNGLGVDIVFSPSGTDAELHAVFIARTLLGTPVTSVVAASDETGSGIADAACGKHFNTLTALGTAVEKGHPIAGLAENLSVVPVPLRDAEGRSRSLAEIDAAIMAATEQAVAAGHRVLLHVMDHSKLGARCPSLACLDAVAARWSGAVQIVIDACQMRLGRARLRSHLAAGHMVLVTGSKFFTGPPFSGALLVPRALARRMEEVSLLPAGLGDYTSRSDWPRGWRGVRGQLRERANLGQLLRWVAAAQEMRDYVAVPASYRAHALARFAEIVPGLIAADEHFELLPDYERLRAGAAAEDEEMAVRTIFPFLLRRDGRALTLAQCSLIYNALNEDVAARLPAGATARQQRLAAQLCHIGQPVAVPDPRGGRTAALRISAGARVVSETWCAAGEQAALANLEGEFAQIRLILEKIALLLRHLDAFEHAAAKAAAA